MSTKEIFPIIKIGSKAFSDSAIKEHQRILKAREARLTKRFVPNIAQFKTVPFMPSFLLRTLNDALYLPPKELSSLQRAFFALWTKHGLKKRHALAQLEKFHKTSQKSLRFLDKRYFEVDKQKLDHYFIKDARKADWTTYLDEKPISTIRIRKALKSRTAEGLNETEKRFLTSACDMPTANIAAAIQDVSKRGMGRFFGLEPEPPPEDLVDIYNFSGKITRWRLLNSSDHICGNADPVFIVQTFYTSRPFISGEDKSTECAGTRILRLGDDVPASGNWTIYEDWRKIQEIIHENPILIAIFGDLLVPPDIVEGVKTVCYGANPTVVVHAFEDDDWISDDFEDYMDFATDFASRVAGLCGGPVSIIFAIVSLAFDLLCWLDDIDSDDVFIFQSWTLPEDQIPNQPSTDFLKVFDMYELNGDNHWEIETKLTITDPIF